MSFTQQKRCDKEKMVYRIIGRSFRVLKHRRRLLCTPKPKKKLLESENVFHQNVRFSSPDQATNVIFSEVAQTFSLQCSDITSDVK